MKKKDWTGNTKTAYAILGASNHSKDERQNEDFYATDPKAVDALLKLEIFNNNIWEPACGMGHISNSLESNGYTVKSSDLFDRGFGDVGIDFLGIDNVKIFEGDIVTNPPYRYAKEFTEKAFTVLNTGSKLAMFLKLHFLEGQDRKILFKKYPLKTLYVSSKRLECAKNGIFVHNTAVAYCWFIWEKGYKGDSIIKWF
jgi:hypothetical protein